MSKKSENWRPPYSEELRALRRKPADDLREMPLEDLVAAGGWQVEQTVIQCYRSADREKVRGALEKRSARGDGVD